MSGIIQLWESLARFQGLIGTSLGIWTRWSQDKAVPPAAALERGGWLQQKTWMDFPYSTVAKGLLDCFGRREHLRLLREREPHAGAWLTCVPNTSFDLTFGVAEFRLLLRQHLGLPLLDQSAVGSACPECGEALGLSGDHLVSCRHAGAWLRQHTLRSVAGRNATAAGFTVKYEEPWSPVTAPGTCSLKDGNRARTALWTPRASTPSTCRPTGYPTSPPWTWWSRRR